MERPLFSIITITFNAAGTLPATLRSVELQTFTDYEYLIVDGASTDGTVAIAQHSAAGLVGDERTRQGFIRCDEQGFA